MKRILCMVGFHLPKRVVGFFFPEHELHYEVVKVCCCGKQQFITASDTGA